MSNLNLKAVYTNQKNVFLNSLPNDNTLKEVIQLDIALFEAETANQLSQSTTLSTKVETLNREVAQLEAEIQALTQESEDQQAAFETSKKAYMDLIEAIVQKHK